MEIDSRELGLRITTTNSWVLRTLGAEQIVAFPSAMVGIEAPDLPISVLVRSQPTPRPLDEFAHALMLRRVGFGTVDPRNAQMFGTNGIRFDWTDGIMDIDSFFVRAARSRIVEVMFSVRPMWGRSHTTYPSQMDDVIGKFVNIRIDIAREP